MNASPLSKSSEQRANEPSMEEILASIRRIIADDRMLPLTQRSSAEGRNEAAAEAAPAPEPVATSERSEFSDEAERAETPIERPAVEQRSLRVLPGGLPPAVEAREAVPTALPIQEEAPSEESGPEAFVTDAECAEVEDETHAVEADDPEDAAPRSDSRLEENATTEQDSDDPLLSEAADASVQSSFQSLARTVFLQNTGMIEQSIRDLLRPLLKQWLDDNLPTIVERLVRSEIERVARGGRF